MTCPKHVCSLLTFDCYCMKVPTSTWDWYWGRLNGCEVKSGSLLVFIARTSLFCSIAGCHALCQRCCDDLILFSLIKFQIVYREDFLFSWFCLLTVYFVGQKEIISLVRLNVIIIWLAFIRSPKYQLCIVYNLIVYFIYIELFFAVNCKKL